MSPQFGKAHTLTLETKAPVAQPGGAVLTFTMSQQFADGKHLLGRFRLSVTNSPRPFDRGQLPADVAAALAVAKEKRSPEQKAALTNYFRAADGRYKDMATTVQQSAEAQKNRRLLGVQDLAWALINNPAFLFNR